MHLLGGPGDDSRRIKEGPKQHSFSDAPFFANFPENGHKNDLRADQKRNLFRAFFQASAQVLPDPLKSMKNDLPDMLF